MKKNNKRSDEQEPKTWVPLVALIISGLASVAALLLAITRGLVAMKVFTVSNVNSLQNWLYISIAVVIVSLAVYAILEPDKVRSTFSGRQARYGSNALVMTLAFLGILVVGNVLAYQYPKTLLDLTEDKTNTLSPEMTKALEKLPQKVTATGFFSSQSPTDSAEKLLSNLKSNSKGKFDYKFSNPDQDPQAAKNAGITGDGKILLQMGNRKEIVAFASEEEILKGLLRLLNPGSHVIYFLSGHGEHDIEQPGDTAMTSAKSALENKNYTVKTLNLLAENKIPEDANVIVIAGPMKPVTEDEVKLLKGYLDKGGSLIVMKDPTPLTDFGDASDPVADMLAKDWGIVFNNDIVVDLNNPQQPTVARAAGYNTSHAITRNMNNLVTYYPNTRSLKAGNAVQDVTLTELVQTNVNSWGETDFKSLTEGGSPVEPDPATEAQGPLTLAIAGENATTKGRVVAFGTSNLAIDGYFDALGNGDMFVNSVDWAAEQEGQINITSKPPTERTMKAPGQLQWIAILLGSIFIIPGLVVLAGVSTWLARKRQG